MEQPRKAVVVTGFGPFGEHTVNASWIAVQELEKLGLGDSVDLHVYEIPVEYQTVQRLIPALWEKHSPQLVVHVGVSGMATTVTLEKCGHNKGYKGLDNCRFCPGSQCCVEDGPESIDSIIDMDAVCKRVTTLGLDVSVTISQDAGSGPSDKSDTETVKLLLTDTFPYISTSLGLLLYDFVLFCFAFTWMESHGESHTY
nr:pyroglutamyl-peptidase 1 isoform X3 [Pan paniscus]